MILLLSAMFTLSSMFIFSVSPIFTSLQIVVFTFFSAVFLLYWGHLWLFYSLVIMFLGGMMVVFVYASSLSVDSKNINSNKVVEFFSLFMLCLTTLYETGFYIDLKISELAASSIYTNYAMAPLALLAMYLLLNLLVLIKLVRWSEGPLKSI